MDRRIAAALRYDRNLPAPFVAATGRGHLAEKLVDTAREWNVPVLSDEELADRLVYLDPGDVVPFELYQPIATIFAYIMSLDKNVRPETSK